MTVTSNNAAQRIHATHTNVTRKSSILLILTVAPAAAFAAYNCALQYIPQTNIHIYTFTHAPFHTAHDYISAMHAVVQQSFAKQTFLRQHKAYKLCSLSHFYHPNLLRTVYLF